MLMVANILDFVVAVITVTIQYPHIDVIMCWYTLCMFLHACIQAFMMCKTSCKQLDETDFIRINFKVKCALIHIHEYMLQNNII